MLGASLNPRAEIPSEFRISGWLLLPLICAVIAAPARGQVFGCRPAAANPIVCENSKQGNSPSEWDISGAGDSSIQGLTTEIRVTQDSVRPATGVGMVGTTIQASSGLVNASTGLTVAGRFPWITYSMWLDFEQDTLESAMKANELAKSTHGTARTWSTANQSTLLTTRTAGQAPDAALGDTGNRGMALDLTSGSVGYIQWNLPVDKSALSFGLWYKTGQPGAWVEGPHFITLFNEVYGPLERLSDERSSSTNARQIRVSPLDIAVTGIADNTWYWCTVKWVEKGTGSFSVYDTSLNLVGTVSFTDGIGFPVQSILLGNSQRTTGASGTTAYFDDLIVDYTHANFPLLPKRSLVSLAVTPANASMGKGGAQQFTATGTFSDGATQNLTRSVTWTSTNTYEQRERLGDGGWDGRRGGGSHLKVVGTSVPLDCCWQVWPRFAARGRGCDRLC